MSEEKEIEEIRLKLSDLSKYVYKLGDKVWEIEKKLREAMK